MVLDKYKTRVDKSLQKAITFAAGRSSELYALYDLQESFLDSTFIFLQIPVVMCHILISCMKLFGGGVVERDGVEVAAEAKCR